MDIYERYGRLMESYQMECDAHRQTLGVLRSLVDGLLPLDHVSISEDNRWTVRPVEIQQMDSEIAS